MVRRGRAARTLARRASGRAAHRAGRSGFFPTRAPSAAPDLPGAKPRAPGATGSGRATPTCARPYTRCVFCDRSLLLFVAGALLLGGAPAGAQEADPVVRVFEVRRINSDFGPIERLSFRLQNDGSRVQPSQWLATLARQVPDGFLAQLLSLRPRRVAGDGVPAWEGLHSRGRRAVLIRVEDDPGAATELPGTRVDLALLRDGEAVWTASAMDAVEVGSTVVLSSRDFEVSPSRYLSWFREAPDLAARERLYERLRDHSIWLVVTVSRPAQAAAAAPALRLDPPSDLRLQTLESSVVPEAKGVAELLIRLDDRGRPRHFEVASTTLPEVTPRLLGIASEWRFPEAAGRQVLITVPVTTRPARRPRSGAD